MNEAPCPHGEWSIAVKIEAANGTVISPGEGRSSLRWKNATLDIWTCKHEGCKVSGLRLNK